MTNTRKEARFFLPLDKLPPFLSEIERFTNEKTFDTPYNRTIYFDSSDQVVPFERSVKARIYDKDQVVGSFTVDPDDEWIFEIKDDLVLDDTRMHHKEREAQLSIMTIVGDRLRDGTGPFLADSYNRQHFHLQRNDEFRITIDTDTRYFRFVVLAATEIGSEDFARIEVKIPGNELDSFEAGQVLSMLQDLGAGPVISKKDAAFNFLAVDDRKIHDRQVQDTDTEIEAKLSLDRDDQHVFHDILADFRAGSFLGYHVIDLPVAGGGKIHVYERGDRFARVSIKGTSKKATFKEDRSIIDGVLVRHEVHVPMDQIDLTGGTMTLYRKRKYFLVEKDDGDFSLCILIDRCTIDDTGDELYQMEVECTLMAPTEDNELASAVAISTIADMFVERYPCLHRSTLTKKDWLSCS